MIGKINTRTHRAVAAMVRYHGKPQVTCSISRKLCTMPTGLFAHKPTEANVGSEVTNGAITLLAAAVTGTSPNVRAGVKWNEDLHKDT